MRFFLTISMIVFLQTTHVVSSGLDDFSKALDPSLNSKEAKDLYQSALDSNDLPLDRQIEALQWIAVFLTDEVFLGEGEHQNYEKAITLLHRSLALSDGTNQYSHKLLADILFNEGDIEGSIKHALRADPDDYENNLVLGRAYFANSDFSDAEEALLKAWEISVEQNLSWGVKDQALLMACMAYTAIFQDSALSNLSDGLAEDYLRKETSDYDDFQNKEYVKILRGDVIENDSLKSFQGKDLAQAHFYAGIRFSILGQNKIALSHFKRAEDIGWQYHIESGSYFPEMIMARGEIRRLSGDSWLLRYVDTKISERSSDEELLMEQIQKEDSLTARALLAHVRFEVAIENFSFYLSELKTYPNFFDKKTAANRLYRAIMYAQSATELDPNDYRYWRLLGEISYRMRDSMMFRSMAIQSYRQIIGTPADDLSVIENLIELYTEMGAFSEALEIYDYALEEYLDEMLSGRFITPMVTACVQTRRIRSCLDKLDLATIAVTGDNWGEKNARIAIAQAMLYRSRSLEGSNNSVDSQFLMAIEAAQFAKENALDEKTRNFAISLLDEWGAN